MKELLQLIETNKDILTIGSALTIDTIKYQKELSKEKKALIPAELIDFLKKYNGIAYDLGCIYAINSEREILPNIIDRNKNNKSTNLLYIGEDNFDYLAYNQTSNSYQIIDKSDNEVLKEHKDLEEAILYIIKI